MAAPLFDTYVMVDWSAASEPATGKNSIWIAILGHGDALVLKNPETRERAIRDISAMLAEERSAGRRVLAGFDFPFGYPAGTAGRLTGKDSALGLWEWLAQRVVDKPDNANNRFAVAEEINRHFDGIGPCWGRPSDWDYPDVPIGGRERQGNDHPPERRCADRCAKGAKTVWQLAYAGSVGSQILLGLPALQRIRRDPRISDITSVWPFETGLKSPISQIVMAEIYPSLVQPDPRERIKDAGQVRAIASLLKLADEAGRLADLFVGPGSLSPAEREVIEIEEAWILGAGQEELLLQFEHTAFHSRSLPAVTGVESGPSSGPSPRRGEGGALPAGGARPLRYERDPQAIYRQSFATVRAEARLDHLPRDLHDVAVRLVHASGMPDIPARLAWSADLAAAARAALASGAPVLCDCEMVASGIVRGRLPAANPVICTLNDDATPGRAEAIGNTRSAAAVELWRPHLAGAVVVIGNAPTALFHLLELLDDAWPRPAAILAFPVGFVGAAESKAELAARPRGVPFLTLRGRRGGSAMAAAALNALAAGLEAPR